VPTDISDKYQTLTKHFADLSRTMAHGSVSRKRAAANYPEPMDMQRVVVMELTACFKGIYDR